MASETAIDRETDAFDAGRGKAGGLRGGAAAIFDQAVVSATNFCTAMAIARFCSKEELGVYYLAWTAIIFLSSVQCNLISIPYTMYWNRRGTDRQASYLGSTLVHQGFTSLLAMLVVLPLIALSAFGVASPAFFSVGWVMLAALPIILFREFLRRLAFAHLRIFAATVMDIGVSVVQFALIAALAWFGRLSVATVIAAVGGACTLSTFLWFYDYRQTAKLAADRILPDLRENWTFSRWALACQLAGLAFYIMPWMLTAVHGEAATGELAACNTLVGLANLFVLGMGNYLTPKASLAFSREGYPGLVRVMKKMAVLFAGTLSMFCFVVYFGGDWLASTVMGPKYHGLGMLIVLMAVATLIDSLSLTAGNGLWALDAPSANFFADCVMLVVSLTVAAVLVRPWGATGIAVAMIAGRLCCAVIRWFTLWERIYSRTRQKALPQMEEI
jgi:O-antigen/teichoic acid export membrane protein